MAIANLKLIAAMRKTADGIESDSIFYCWTTIADCNCGLVARELLNISRTTLFRRVTADWMYLSGGDWGGMADQFSVCPATSLPLDSIIQELIDAGFELPDLRDLEYLRNKDVLDRAGIEVASKGDSGHVIRYLRAWAGMLEEQLSPEPEAIEEEAGEMELAGVG